MIFDTNYIPYEKYILFFYSKIKYDARVILIFNISTRNNSCSQERIIVFEPNINTN